MRVARGVVRVVDVKLQFSVRVRRSALDGDAIAQSRGALRGQALWVLGESLRGVHKRSAGSNVSVGREMRRSRFERRGLRDRA